MSAVRSPSKRPLVPFLCVAVVMGLAPWIVIACLVAGSDPYHEAPFRRDVAQSAVTMVQSGALRPNRFGVVHLPWGVDGASADGLITVTHGKRGLLLIYFPSRNERFGARGYLYVSRPLTAADITKTPLGVAGILIKSERGEYTYGDPQVEAHGYSIAVPLSRQLDPHWWRVAAPDNVV